MRPPLHLAFAEQEAGHDQRPKPVLFVALYLLILLLVAAWSDISEDFYKDGHWFGDAVLLLFWDAYTGFVWRCRFVYRLIGDSVAELVSQFASDLDARIRASSWCQCLLRRETRRKGGAK